MSHRVTPIHDLVLVRRDDPDTMVGSIHLPASNEKTNLGTVVSVGPGRPLPEGGYSEMSAKAGDRVMFDKFAPVPIKVDDEELWFVRESAILAVFGEED